MGSEALDGEVFGFVNVEDRVETGKLQQFPNLAVQIRQFEFAPRGPTGIFTLGTGIPLALIVLEY